MTARFPLAWDVPVLIGREEARRRALDELAKAKYGGTPGWLTDLLDRAQSLLERVLELVYRVQAARGAGGGPSLGFVLAVVLLVAAIGLVVWRVGLPRWRRRVRDGAVEADPMLAATDYRERSTALAAEGDWRGAVRDRFRAVVRELEVRTVLDVRPARTAWEAAASAGRVLPDCRDRLVDAADTFSSVVYGERAADPTAYERMVALDAAVTDAADRVDLAADAGEPVGR